MVKFKNESYGILLNICNESKLPNGLKATCLGRQWPLLVALDPGDKGILHKPGPFIPEMNIQTWLRNQRREKRIQGKGEHMQAQLLPPTNKANK